MDSFCNVGGNYADQFYLGNFRFLKPVDLGPTPVGDIALHGLSADRACCPIV